VLGLLTASACMGAAFIATFFVTWAAAMTSLAAGGPGDFQSVPPQTSIEIAVAAVALGLLIGLGAGAAGQPELRRWEDLTAGIEYHVRTAVTRATVGGPLKG
jgi:NO-binding membrane sensor protein with MHYT domain